MTYNIRTSVSSPELSSFSYSGLKKVYYAIAEAEDALRDYEKIERNIKTKMLKHNNMRSSVFSKLLTKAEQNYNKALDIIQQNLNLELEHITDNEIDLGSANYIVDTNLSYNMRYQLVKEYYLSFSNKQEAFDEYSIDSVAVDYLGIYYYTLYDYLSYRADN